MAPQGSLTALYNLPLIPTIMQLHMDYLGTQCQLHTPWYNICEVFSLVLFPKTISCYYISATSESELLTYSGNLQRNTHVHKA